MLDLTRRALLAMMGAAVLEESLWVPGKKLISIPAPGIQSPERLHGWLYSFNGADLIASNKGVFMIVSPTAATWNSSVMVMSGSGLRHMHGPLHPQAQSLDLEVELRGSVASSPRSGFRSATIRSSALGQRRYSGWIE